MTQERIESSGGAAENPLPKLKATQVVKSKEPFIEVDQYNRLTPESAVIQPFGEYTVTLAKDAKEIVVYDKQGNRVKDIGNPKVIIVDWQTLSKKNSYSNYAGMVIDTDKIDGYYKDSYRRVGEFPHELQIFIRKYITQRSKDKNVEVFPRSNWGIDTTKIDQLLINTGEGFFVIDDPSSGTFIAFQTHNEQGIDLPTRNWRRIDNVDDWVGRLPANINSMLDNFKKIAALRKENPNLRTTFEFGNGLRILSLDDKLVITALAGKVDNALFVDRLGYIGNNVCQDPRNEGVIYYCTGNNPKTILRLDTTKDPGLWQTEAVDIPQTYKSLRGLRFDPTGNFFMFESEGDFTILARDTLQEVQKIPKLYNAMLDTQGRITGLDEKGHLVIYDVNFGEVAGELNQRRVTQLAKGLATDLFKKEATQQQVRVGVDQFKHLEPVKTDLETQFNAQLQAITNLEDISTITEALTRLRTRLQSEGLQSAQIEFITRGIQDSIAGKERILAAPVVAQGLVDLNTKLAGNLTIASISEAKGDLAKLKSLEGLVDDATRAQIRALESQFSQQSAELFRREGAVIEKDVGEMVRGVRTELEKMVSMPDFADWQEFRLPQLVSRLGSLANDCPLEASETQKKILAARRQLQELSRDYETRFKEKYAQVREKASEVMGERVELMKTDMDSLVDRLRGRGFKDRLQVESYVRSSEALEALRSEITELARQNPDAAKELDRELKVRLATVMSEVERGGLTSIAETGQQMVLFGDTLFPRWEGKVQEKVQRHVDLVFIPDERTKGPGVSADKVLGDIGIMEINSRGKLEKKRLYEGMRDEDERRYGSVLYRGEYIFPSYVSQAEYRKIKKDWADWSRGDASKIRRTLREKRQALHEWYQKRQKIGERNESRKELRAFGWTREQGDWRDEREVGVDAGWKRQYSEMLSDYAKFAVDNHLFLLSRIERLQKAPETEFANGSGYVPEWSSHWTTDQETERYLEEIAKDAKMQIDLQEGLLLLRGHAGTGKDVLVKMFANRTNRPYFTIDCSKWTTEFELSEDVVLEAEDGASKTVKVPSVVLNAITTPGAVMYFNEINAMPEQAQIFLHGLMDEKRTLTLKTSSGKAVKTLDSVLLMGSMNPGYPGTYNPQFATRSRMVTIGIDYPPLYRKKDASDRNPNPPLSAAEALRAARQVDSLADFTYETNPEHNEFIKIWDRHINGIQNGAFDLTPLQRFDMEAILTLVEFAQKLREGFMLKFEKTRASSIPRGALLVSQPITGRDVRRCAYFLSKMPENEKSTANPETVVRNLLERLFLENIDDREEKSQIRTAMATWTSSKRPAA